MLLKQKYFIKEEIIMKKTTSTKIVNVTKSLVTLGSNFGIFTLSFFSIASLVLLLGQFDISQLIPEGAEVTKRGEELMPLF